MLPTMTSFSSLYRRGVAVALHVSGECCGEDYPHHYAAVVVVGMGVATRLEWEWCSSHRSHPCSWLW